MKEDEEQDKKSPIASTQLRTHGACNHTQRTRLAWVLLTWHAVRVASPRLHHAVQEALVDVLLGELVGSLLAELLARMRIERRRRTLSTRYRSQESTRPIASQHEQAKAQPFSTLHKKNTSLPPQPPTERRSARRTTAGLSTTRHECTHDPCNTWLSTLKPPPNERPEGL